MDHDHPFYKWVVLSNTHAGSLLASINAVGRADLAARASSVASVSELALAPANVSYLLWMLMGYLVVARCLVVFFGDSATYSADAHHNSVFCRLLAACGGVALSFDPFHLGGGAMWLIGWRVGAEASAVRC